MIAQENLQNNCAVVGTYLLEELAKLKERCEVIGDVRGKGLMIGVELVSDRKTRAPLAPERMGVIFEKIKEMGLLTGKGGLSGNVSIAKYCVQIPHWLSFQVLRIKPPMCVTKQDVDFAIGVLADALRAS